VADVRVHAGQVRGAAAVAAGVDRHHLHQADRALAAHRGGIELAVLDEEHGGEEARAHADPSRLAGHRPGRALGHGRVSGPPGNGAGERLVREARGHGELERGAVDADDLRRADRSGWGAGRSRWLARRSRRRGRRCSGASAGGGGRRARGCRAGGRLLIGRRAGGRCCGGRLSVDGSRPCVRDRRGHIGLRRERQRTRAAAARGEGHGERGEARIDCAATTHRERQGLSR